MNYVCDRKATGSLDRKQLIDHINKIALETPDEPENVPYVTGTVRGKKVNSGVINDPPRLAKLCVGSGNDPQFKSY